MRVPLVLVVLVVAACGRSAMLDEGATLLLPSPTAPACGLRQVCRNGSCATTIDSCVVDAGQPDAGAVDAGLWCAAEGQDCLADGTERAVPGHCCNGRQSCAVDGRFRRCAY